MTSRFYTLAAALLMGAAACAQTLLPSVISEQSQLETLGMSANHRYICGLNVATYCGFVWDTQTGEVVQNRGDYANCDFRCVTNDGTAFGILGTEDMVTTNAACFDIQGKVSFLDGEMSQVFDVTPDGSMAVGCLLDPTMWWPSACIWTADQRIALPCPTQEECGIPNDGANAQFVSEDGSVIAGYLQDWYSSRPAIIWRRQADGSYQADVISAKIWEQRYGQGKPYMRFQALGLSKNGQWLCLSGQREASGSMPTPEFMIRMNLQTGEIFESETPSVPFFEPSVDNCYPSGIANDGTCVGSIRDEIGFVRGVIWPAGEKSPRLLADLFPAIDKLALYDGFMHLPIAISPDAQYIAGFGCPVTYYPDGPDFDYQAYLLSRGTADGVEQIRSTSLPTGDRFTLSGQRIPRGFTPRGIVIENGRKVLR